MTGERSDDSTERARRSYDRIAGVYRERFENELDDKPFDRAFVESIASSLDEGAVVVDIGGGPGQIGREVAGTVAWLVNVDLSYEMLRQSREPGAGMSAVQADMRDLPFRAGSVDCAVAFFSLIHIAPRELADVVAAISRVVRPGGLVATATHATPPAHHAAGNIELDDGGLRVEEMLSRTVQIDFYFHGTRELTEAIEHAGLTVLQVTEREPYADDVEAQTRRTYLLARKGD